MYNARRLLILFISLLIGAIILYIVCIPKKLQLEPVRHFHFSKESSLQEWREKIFKGRVLYRVKTKGRESFVLATSRGTASALFYKIRLDMDRRPVVSWKWSAKKFPVKDALEDLTDAGQDDFAARVYVIFPAFFFTSSRALEYIWTEKIGKGTIADSPYSKNLKLFVIESGRDNAEWLYEERDIYEDYLKAFGEEPRLDIGAVAFMTDADSTDSSAETFYDEINLSYKKR